MVTIPGLTASLFQRHVCELLTIGLCDMDSPLHSGEDPFPATRELSRCVCLGRCSPGKFCLFPVNTLGRSCLISTSADSEEIKREEQGAADQALTKEDFTVNGSFQQLSATLLDLRCWPTPQAGRRARCLLRSSP